MKVYRRIEVGVAGLAGPDSLPEQVVHLPNVVGRSLRHAFQNVHMAAGYIQLAQGLVTGLGAPDS